MWLVLALIIALAVLGPLFGADSRDGLDWARGDFWLRRRLRPDRIRNSDSPAREGAAPASAERRRSVPAAG
ncbi:hypothetical protein GCM10010191_40700 [Actinomadura vinacea]|uniref:Uncharacterized protein n=1 Tax=Actinomadura vinacea TaxID=115336 RepID=A0ABP5WDS0_9ACTN